MFVTLTPFPQPKGLLMNPLVLRRAKQLRAKNPWLPMATAIAIARGEVEPDVGAYEFLADFEESKAVTGMVGPFTVHVHAKLDDDFELGEDDVTGTFTDTWEPGCVANSSRGVGALKWYKPSNYTLTELYPDLRRRMGRAVARQEYARIVEAEMDDDRERYALGVVVAVFVGDDSAPQSHTDRCAVCHRDAHRPGMPPADHGHVYVAPKGQARPVRTMDEAAGRPLLASGAVWGIDQVPSVDGRPYLVEVARELVEEALDRARERLEAAERGPRLDYADVREALALILATTTDAEQVLASLDDAVANNAGDD